MSISIILGNFLYKNVYPLYKPLYGVFKRRQDAFEISLLKKYVKPGFCVLDIGANIGFYANIISRLVGPNGKVHCFEPDEINFNRLQQATSDKQNIVINNKAVAAETGEISIYTSKNLNVDHRTYRPEEYDQELKIQGVSIDDYILKQASTKKVDVIKMDIQGFELQALQGMEKTLFENKNIVIFSEFWPYGLNKAGSSVTEYFNLLIEKGFECFLIEKNSLDKLTIEKVRSLEKLGEQHYFNILATRTDV